MCSPLPGHVTVVWFRGGNAQSYLVDVPSPETHSLTLTRADLADAGLYQCMAYNHLGCSHTIVNVTVVEETGLCVSQSVT